MLQSQATQLQDSCPYHASSNYPHTSSCKHDLVPRVPYPCIPGSQQTRTTETFVKRIVPVPKRSTRLGEGTHKGHFCLKQARVTEVSTLTQSEDTCFPLLCTPKWRSWLGALRKVSVLCPSALTWLREVTSCSLEPSNSAPALRCECFPAPTGYRPPLPDGLNEHIWLLKSPPLLPHLTTNARRRPCPLALPGAGHRAPRRGTLLHHWADTRRDVVFMGTVCL